MLSQFPALNFEGIEAITSFIRDKIFIVKIYISKNTTLKPIYNDSKLYVVVE